MSVWIYVVAAVVLALVFGGVWLLDARRAEKVSHDPERQEEPGTAREGFPVRDPEDRI